MSLGFENGDVHITVTAAGKGQKISLLSPRAFSQPNNRLTANLQPGAGQGIPYPDRGP